MTRFARRRARNGGLVLLFLLPLGGLVYLQSLALQDGRALTGWLLLAAFLVLALYNLRKKLPFLPLGAAASWLQLHLYLGLSAAVLFLLHTRAGLPEGRYELLLWLLSLGLFVTGALGLLLSRLAPPALTWHGERIVYERIPALRRRLADEVEALAAGSVEGTASGTIAGYHADVLKGYFAGPRHRRHHLVRSKRPLRHLTREIRTLERYLTAEGRATLSEIEERVVAKDNLDFQETWQGLLKLWLFLHIPLTYGALILIPLHVVLAYAFGADGP